MKTVYLRYVDVGTNVPGMQPYVELERGERVVSVETLASTGGYQTFRIWIASK